MQSHDTMGKLKETNGYVTSTLEKLPGIRADLVRLDKDWQEWKFGQFAEVLRQWTERNRISHERRPLDNSKNDRLFSTKQSENKIKLCVSCNKGDHKSIQCKAVTDTNKQRKILRKKKLCFNCTGEKHRVSECKSECRSVDCNRKHHTSTCD